MTGETHLPTLIAQMEPVLLPEDFVFASVDASFPIDHSQVKGLFQEKEGTSLILTKAKAEELQLEYDYLASCITLNMHSALEAVGLTAAFSNALAENNISCNVVAAYYHDHIFVDKEDAQRAMNVLHQMKNTNK
nr:ACT domain-containing protein [Allomuricauda sp.]